MNDILPEEAPRWHRLEGAFRRAAELAGYAEIRTPILELTTLFAREIGEATDVVEKEMYSFERHGDHLTVRPEGTAGAARAYVEHAVHAREAVSRWYYIGPMFRGERPAKGRYRQFYQAGCEHFGDGGPTADAEMIDLLVNLLASLGIPGVAVHVNSLGSGDTRARYREALRAYFEPMKARLSEDSQRRLDKNPLRILDSKDPRDREALVGAPSILELLDADDRAHFEAVQRYLGVLGVDVVVDPTLVRGLDYYTRTLFEIRTTTGDLGAQNTLVGGGRYDNMIESLGGPKVPAIGFAMGLERLLATMPDEPSTRAPGCYLAPMNAAGLERALVLGRELRRHGVRAEVDGRGGKLKTMLRRADALGARYCLLLGDSELERGVVAVKDLAAHAQEELALADAAAILARRIAELPPAAAPASAARGAH
jgi:histidyl-tRNA synthetase